MTSPTLSTRFSRAYERAEASEHNIWQIGPSTYKCHSFDPKKPGTWYILVVSQRGITCTCLGGWYVSQICKHKIKLAKRLRREHKAWTLSEWFHESASDREFEVAIMEVLPQLAVAPEPEPIETLVMTPWGIESMKTVVPPTVAPEPNHINHTVEMASSNVLPFVPKPTPGGKRLQDLFD